MGCNNKIKLTCGTKNFSTCIDYQGTVSANTTLDETECLDVQEVIEDLYAMVDIVKEEIDLSEVTSQCDTLPIDRTVASMIQFLVDTICTQEEKINELVSQVNIQAAEILALQENTCP